jgi:hypothetical protein
VSFPNDRSEGPQPTVLLYGEDAGDSYYFWQWLDDESEVSGTFVVPQAGLAAALAELDRALPGGSDSSLLERVSSGAFGSVATESVLARRLGEQLIDEKLAQQLAVRAANNRSPVLMRILPSPSCTRVPWELLDFNGRGERLISIADISIEPPIGLYGVRDQQPAARADGGTVYVIDPRRTGLLPVMDEREVRTAKKLLHSAVAGNPDVQGVTTRGGLSALLSSSPPPSRLVFFGHVANVESDSGSPVGAEPGEAALVLSDDANFYGVTGLVGGELGRDYSRPLSALDLIHGTNNPEAHAESISKSKHFRSGVGVKYPASPNTAGWAIWPMPPRVALIGCESGGDLAHIEPYGLVIACLNAGAALVTATRWTVPTDRMFRDDLDSADDDPHPLLELVRQVDIAHGKENPVQNLATWQREQLTKWLASGDFDSTTRLHPASPVLWASLATTVAPRKEPRPLTDEEHKLLGDRVKLPAQTA